MNRYGRLKRQQVGPAAGCTIRTRKGVLPAESRLCVRLLQGNVTCARRIPDHPALDYVAELERLSAFFSDRLCTVDAVCIVATSLSGVSALSCSGAVFVDEALLANPATLMFRFLPHELAHQWFGGLVNFRGDGTMWLREGLPEYLQLLYLRDRFGERMFRKGLAYTERLHAMLSRLSRGSRCHQVAGSSEWTEEQELEAIRGTAVWHALHQLIGDQAIWNTLRALCFVSEPVTTDIVLSIAESQAGVSLKAFRSETLEPLLWPLPASRLDA